MKEITPLEKLYSLIYTTDDLNSFYKELDEFTSTLFQISQTVESALDSVFNTQEKEAILKYLTSQKADLKDQVSVQEKISFIKNEGQKFPIVTLKLGYDPTRNHLESFSTWFLTRVKRKVIFEILVERELIAGAYITYNGLFHDYSIKGRLNQLFEDKKYVQDLLSGPVSHT